MSFSADSGFYKYRKAMAKAIVGFGLGTSTGLILPDTTKETRRYVKAEDSIPVFVKPLMSRTIDALTGEERKEIKEITQEPLYLDFEQGKFLLIVSPPGAGKTFLMRGIAGELHEAGYSVVCLADQKNDFYWSRYPVQDEFKRHLPPWRVAKGLPMACITPAYIRYKERDLKFPPDVVFFKLSLKDLTAEDLVIALSLEFGTPQANLLQFIWNPDNPPKTMADLYGRIQNVDMKSFLRGQNIETRDKIGTAASQTINALIFRIGRLHRENFIGDDGNIDIIDIISRGYFLDLCLFDNSLYPYHTAYVYNLIRRIYKEKKRGGKLEHVRMAFLFPDMGTFVLPNKKDPISKELIERDLISLGRQKGIYVIGDTQNLSQIPDTAKEQVQTWIFYGTISGHDLEVISKINKKKYSDIRELMDNYGKDLMTKFPLRGAIVWENVGGTKLGFVPPPSSAHGLKSA